MGGEGVLPGDLTEDGDGFLDGGGGDQGGAGQVDDLAQVGEIVEAAAPVVAHDEDIDAETADVVAFLVPGVFGDDVVDEANGADDVSSVCIGDDGALALALVEFVGGDGDEKSVAAGARALQELEMAHVEEVEGAVGDDGFHAMDANGTGVWDFMQADLMPSGESRVRTASEKSPPPR